jgi:hypothetical protein
LDPTTPSKFCTVDMHGFENSNDRGWNSSKIGKHLDSVMATWGTLLRKIVSIAQGPEIAMYFTATLAKAKDGRGNAMLIDDFPSM